MTPKKSYSSARRRCSAARTKPSSPAEMIEAGNEEQGLARLEQAMKDHPNDVEIRNYYLRHKAVAVQRYLQIGDNARSSARSTPDAYQRAQLRSATPTRRPGSTPWRASARRRRRCARRGRR